MNSVIRSLVVLASIVVLAGCVPQPVVYQPAPLTPEERGEIQTRVLNSDFDTVFAATIAVLQDEAWDLQDVKKDSGMIIGATKRRVESNGPSEDWRFPSDTKAKPKTGITQKKNEVVINEWTRWEKLTVQVEPWGEGKVRERINIVKFGTQPAVSYSYPVGGKREIMVSAQAKEEQEIAEDPLAYSRLFARIERAIGEREQKRGATP